MLTAHPADTGFSSLRAVVVKGAQWVAVEKEKDEKKQSLWLLLLTGFLPCAGVRYISRPWGGCVCRCVCVQVPHHLTEETLHILGLSAVGYVTPLGKASIVRNSCMTMASPSVQLVFGPSEFFQRVFKTGISVWVWWVGWVEFGFGFDCVCNRPCCPSWTSTFGPKYPLTSVS